MLEYLDCKAKAYCVREETLVALTDLITVKSVSAVEFSVRPRRAWRGCSAKYVQAAEEPNIFLFRI